MKSLSLMIFVMFLTVTIACKREIKRYIDENDENYSEDIRSVSQKINKNPGDAELYYQRANTFYYEKRFKDALEDMKIAIELNPKNAVYQYKLGEIYFEQDTIRARPAEEAYRKATELNPDYVEARLKLSKLLIAQLRYNEAVEELRKVTDKNPTNIQALFFLGIANKEMKDTVMAVQRFREVTELDRTAYDAYMQLALIYMDKDPDMALLYLDNALRVDDFSDEAHYTKGLILQRQNQMVPAREFYKRTIELNPTHLLAYYNLAYLDLIDGKTESALDFLSRLLDMHPEDVSALHLRGVIYKDLKNYDKARVDLLKALSLEPDNKEIKEDLEM